MRVRELLRDCVLIGAAAAVGWWAHGAGTPVAAGSLSSSGGDASANAGLAFQFMGVGSQADLAVYNPANRTLYVYPRVGVGNSHISCEYSFHIRQPGAAMDRENCPVGEQLP